MEEVKAMDVKDFFIGGELNMELKLEGGREGRFRGLESID